MVNYSVRASHDELLVQIRRIFAARRERVFAAWAEPEQLQRWMCRDVPSHVITHHLQDIQTGGRWKMEIHDSAKNEVYWGEGEYLEVRPPEKIVFTWSWFKEVPGSANVNMHPESPVTEVTVEFFDRGQQTELLLTHRGLGSERLREEHEGGWVGCLSVLEKILQHRQ